MNSEKMIIAYVGPFSFPSSNANSLRVKGMAEAMVLAGHEVHICAGAPIGGAVAGEVPSKGIHIHQVDEYESGFCSGLHRGARGLFLGDVTLRWLDGLQRKPDVVVLYGTHLGYLLRMLAFCKRNKIPLILDVVEWYDPRHLPGGMFGPFAIANELSMRLVAKRADGMFTISRYLEAHFSKQGCKTLRVPPLFSFSQIRPPQFRASNRVLNLCYAGSPGKKEDMKSLFMGLQMAYEAGIKFTMHIVGITAAEFSRDFGLESLSVLKAKSTIIFYGRVENAEARRIVSSSDFLVLLRKNTRVIAAGFPSKLAESLCLGTPTIANLSSNLDEYLISGNNSIIIDYLNPRVFCDALSHASLIDDFNLSKIKKTTQAYSNNFFDPKKHAMNIGGFINDIR